MKLAFTNPSNHINTPHFTERYGSQSTKKEASSKEILETLERIEDKQDKILEQNEKIKKQIQYSENEIVNKVDRLGRFIDRRI